MYFKVDSETSFHIKKLGPHRQNDISEIHEDYLYEGRQNPLVLSRSYTVTLTCRFELQLYPFDHQECPMKLQVPFELETHMILQWAAHPTFDDSIKFLQYSFIGVSSKGSNSTTLTVYLHLNR